MRKRLPMSALITGLLAAPVLGATGLSTANSAPPLMERWAETFPAQMPLDISERMRRVARGEKLNAFGMQGLQSRLSKLVQARIARRRAEGSAPVVTEAPALYPVQLAQGQPVQGQPITGRMEKVAYLGVAPSPVPEAMGAQLNLPRGMGLVVDFVDPDSPADKAGLKKNDVLQKLEDQWLVNAAQMQTLVRAKKAGETIAFTVIRGGKPVEVKVTLAEKEVLLTGAQGSPAGTLSGGPGIVLANAGETVIQRISKSSLITNSDGSITRGLRDDEHDIAITRDKNGRGTATVKNADGRVLYDGPIDGAAAALPAPVAKKVADLLSAPNEVRVELRGDAITPDAPGTIRKNNYMLSRDDGVHQITIQADGAGKRLTVKEVATGKVVFDGPVNTDADMKTVPAAVLEKVQAAMEKVGGG